MAVHPISAFIALYVRWWLVPKEQDLPTDEYRNFAGIIDASVSWWDRLSTYCLTPVILYLMWLLPYYFLLFLSQNNVRLVRSKSAFGFFLSKYVG